jgi:competence protein ComEC
MRILPRFLGPQSAELKFGPTYGVPWMILAVALGLIAGSGVRAATPADEARHDLDFYFIDTEGGAATLIVTPAGESILIDSGNPGDRDAGRIAAAAKDAGITAIDHYITTHWHSDHVGGAAPLAALLPIHQTYGHAIPDPLPQDISAPLIEAWKGIAVPPRFLEAGDNIKLRGSRGSPTPHLHILAANGLVEGEKPGAAAITTCNDGIEARPEDTTDNARSLAMLISFGTFDLFAGGDLTWNIEHKLTCPKRLVPAVDVYLVDHHGLDLSNNPALVAALAPEVAIVNNGPRKGAEPRTMLLLEKQLRDVGVFQLHSNLRDGARNTDLARIANAGEGEADAGTYVHLSVDSTGSHYTITVPSRQTVREHDAR